MSFITYAQNFEDVMLWRALKSVKNGFYIDVGANHPEDDSVTKAFYDQGWSGINIEPEERFFDLLQLDRDRDTNLDYAISNQRDDIKLYIFETRGWSTNDLNVAKEHEEEGHSYQTKRIKTKSLDQVCEENQIEDIHFLKIDVEGAEKSVLESFSFDQYRPWIIVIEATKPNTDIDISQEWEFILFEHDYLFAYFDGINKYYVAKEQSSLLEYFRYPPNAFDDFISINQYRAQMRIVECEAKQYRAEMRVIECESKMNLASKKSAESQVIADNAEQHYLEIIDSSSWQITKPLRELKDMIHKLRVKSADSMDLNDKEEKRQLLVDVSQIYFDDNQTGIQRVIHNIIKELSALSIEGYALLPIYATMEREYHYTSKFNSESECASTLDEQPVVVCEGDIFLGLDLTAHLFPNIEETLKQWRENNVSINYVIYDIIPLLHPQFTTEGMDEYFRTWLNGLMGHADRLICISQSVADELRIYTDENFPLIEHKPKITSFHLGAGIGNYSGSEKLPDMKGKLTFLIVGTVEPRKGHSQLLSAFEKLWSEGQDINLVIVGKKGWMVDALLDKIITITERKQHLTWLEGISDEYLSSLYSSSSCLIIASETEGFGLPMIEAAKYDLPIIARDIPVFREIAGDHAFYFTDNHEVESIAQAITEWMELFQSDTHPRSSNMPWLTWRESTLQLLECLEVRAGNL